MSLELVLLTFTSDVTDVQTNENEGFHCNVTQMVDVAAVAKIEGLNGTTTSVTSLKQKALQPKSLAGNTRTLVTAVTSFDISTENETDGSRRY